MCVREIRSSAATRKALLDQIDDARLREVQSPTSTDDDCGYGSLRVARCKRNDTEDRTHDGEKQNW